MEWNNRILIVDDNQDIHRDFRKIFKTRSKNVARDRSIRELEQEIFNDAPPEGEETEWVWPDLLIDSAFSGKEGLSMVCQARDEGKPYAVVFVDVRMPPGDDGVIVSGKILEQAPHTRLVIVTAYSDYTGSQMRERLTPHKFLYMKKPFDPLSAQQMALTQMEAWNVEMKRLVEQKALNHSNYSLSHQRDYWKYVVSLNTPVYELDYTLVFKEIQRLKQEGSQSSAAFLSNPQAVSRLAQEVSFHNLMQPESSEYELDSVEIGSLATDYSSRNPEIFPKHFKHLMEKGHTRFETDWTRVNRYGIPEKVTLIMEKRDPVKPNMVIASVIEKARAAEDYLKDDLTGLPNRVLFGYHLDQSWLEYERSVYHSPENPRRFAVIFLDLNGFKAINDKRGHVFGDAYLKEFSRRLQKRRSTDVTSRRGGDEFTILARDLAHENSIFKVLEGIEKVLSQGDEKTPPELEDVQFSVSLGCVVCPDDTARKDQLLSFADQAMYYAKTKSSDHFRIALWRWRVEVSRNVQKALEKGQYEVLFQPCRRLAGDTPVMASVAMLTLKMDDGRLQVEDFMEVLAQSGDLEKTLEWFCQEVRKALTALPKYQLPSVLAFHLTDKPFREPGMAQSMARWLDGFIDRLVVELPEDHLRPEDNLLQELKAQKFKICLIDHHPDRGLTYLPYVDFINIDFNWALELAKSHVHSEARTDLEFLFRHAPTYEYKVIGRNVTSEEDADFLKSHGFYGFQGDLACRGPLPLDAYLAGVGQLEASVKEDS